MSTDFSQKERAFVADLKPETGRDLDQWMSAIAGSGLQHRNDIIDWLRHAGLTFAHASWLERIHHNGGNLIYAPATAGTDRSGTKRKPKPTNSPVKSTAPTAHTAVPSDHDLDDLLASAKAYRPLAQVLLRDILAAIPGADASRSSATIVISHARPFAAICPTPKDVRLYLALGARSVEPEWQKLRPEGADLDHLSPLTHMIVLNDARQLTKELMGLVVVSASSTGKST
jgi:hypothetical protein